MSKGYGERIRDYRRKYGMTREEFGEMVDVAGVTVSRWESGDTAVRGLIKVRLDWVLFDRDWETSWLDGHRSSRLSPTRS